MQVDIFGQGELRIRENEAPDASKSDLGRTRVTEVLRLQFTLCPLKSFEQKSQHGTLRRQRALIRTKLRRLGSTLVSDPWSDLQLKKTVAKMPIFEYDLSRQSHSPISTVKINSQH